MRVRSSMLASFWGDCRLHCHNGSMALNESSPIDLQSLPTQHKVVIGDSRDMAEISDESVHLVVTSPPYWQLKDYGHPSQIGFDDSYEDYINNLNLVWDECRRVLHPGCRLCVNIGDQFARSVYYGRYKVIPIRTEITKFCESDGFDYMGAVIWQKVTTTNTSGGASVMGSYPYPRNGIVKIDYEFILLFKKYGTAPKPSAVQKEASRLSDEEWQTYFTGHWNFPGERQADHLAMFPEELPRRLIKMFSFAGDTVLDPFLGSGTTALAARNLGRNSIGYEINPDFRAIIRQKLAIDTTLPLDDHRLTFIEKQNSMQTTDMATRRLSLPYVFRDPVKVDKKLDPRKLSFGSKISGREEKNGEDFVVERVVASNLLGLKGGVQVRLLGVRPVPNLENRAVEYLEATTKGGRVSLRFDGNNFDEAGNLLAYVYLQNKTFLNAHLIKRGLAAVDTGTPHRMRSRFDQYAARALEEDHV